MLNLCEICCTGTMNFLEKGIQELDSDLNPCQVKNLLFAPIKIVGSTLLFALFIIFLLCTVVSRCCMDVSQWKQNLNESTRKVLEFFICLIKGIIQTIPFAGPKLASFSPDTDELVNYLIPEYLPKQTIQPPAQPYSFQLHGSNTFYQGADEDNASDID